MKFLVIAVAFVAGPALACPADGSKDADAARSTEKAVVAKSTEKPAPQVRVAKQKPASAKVAVRSTADASKAPSL